MFNLFKNLFKVGRVTPCAPSSPPPISEDVTPNPSIKNAAPIAVPSPLPSDGRGEGQGEVRVSPICPISPIRPITSTPPVSEDVSPDLPVNDNCPTAFPSPGGEGKGEGELKTNFFPLEPSTKRNGKIAKLPRALRDRINQALDLGQSATSIAQYLNQLPEVKAMLNAHFDGKPISQQNLSEWKAGGYRDWQLRQELVLQHQEFTADVQELGRTAHGMADALFGMVTFDYARLIKNKDKETPESFEKKRKALSASVNDIARLCRCEVQTRNVVVQESRLERDREKTTEELFQKFMEWADNPTVRKTFFLAPEVRMAAQRQNFGLPPRPQDAAVMAEFQSHTDSAQTPENQANQTDIKPSQTEKSECNGRGDEALTKVGRDTPCSPSSPSPTTEDAVKLSNDQNAGPTASPSPGREGWGEGELTSNSKPSGSPEGCGTLAGDNIPGKESPLTMHPEGVRENIPSTNIASIRPISPIRPIASTFPASEDITPDLQNKNTRPTVSPSPGGEGELKNNSKPNPQNSTLGNNASPWDSFSEPCGSHTPRAHAYPPYENPLKYYGPCPPPQTPGSRWKVRGI